MSNREETTSSTEAVDASGVYDFLQRRYHAIALVLAMVFMFWTRFQSYDLSRFEYLKTPNRRRILSPEFRTEQTMSNG